jgi:hypothetical protein
MTQTSQSAPVAGGAQAEPTTQTSQSAPAADGGAPAEDRLTL